jgi:hypothetical protein
MELAYRVSDLAVDRDEAMRPGVPMEKRPDKLFHKPENQVSDVKVFKRVGLEEMTPVFGTCQPPRGLSGLVKARAFQIPEDKAAHWALLLLSDRIDVVEGRVIDAFTRKPYVGFWALAGLGLGYYFYRNHLINQTMNFKGEST